MSTTNCLGFPGAQSPGKSDPTQMELLLQSLAAELGAVGTATAAGTPQPAAAGAANPPLPRATSGRAAPLLALRCEV